MRECAPLPPPPGIKFSVEPPFYFLTRPCPEEEGVRGLGVVLSFDLAIFVIGTCEGRATDVPSLRSAEASPGLRLISHFQCPKLETCRQPGRRERKAAAVDAGVTEGRLDAALPESVFTWVGTLSLRTVLRKFQTLSP